MKSSGYPNYESDRRAQLRRRTGWRLALTEAPMGHRLNPLTALQLRSPTEVALLLGITRQRVQQIERNAIGKIREAFASWLKEERL